MKKREQARSITLVRVWRVMQREMKGILRHPIYPIGMILIPILSMLVLLSIMGKGLPDSIPLAVVDEDNTVASRAVVRNLDAMEQSMVVMQTEDFSSAREAMQEGRVYGIFIIPKDFQADVMSGKRPKIDCYTNNSYLMAGSLLFRDMRIMSELASGKVILENGLARGQRMDEIMGKAQPIKVQDHIIGNPWLNYSIYLNSNIIPGIMSLLILQLTVFSIGIEIKRQKAGHWLHMAGGSIRVAVFGKLMVHTLMYLFTAIVCMCILYGVYSFPVNGGLLPMFIGLLLFILASEALGIFFITLIPILRLGLSLASLFGMLSFSMAGFSYPTSAMYPPIRSLANIFPLRHYYLTYVDSALNGRPFVYNIPHYAALMVFIVLPFLVLPILKESLRRVPYIE